MKIFYFHPSAGLSFNFSNDFGNSNPAGICGLRVIPPKITDRLKMDPPYRRHHPDRKLDDAADIIVVDSGHQGWYEDYAQILLITIYNSFLFHTHQPVAANFPIDLIVSPVKLKKDTVEPSFFEDTGIADILSQSQAIRVQLEETEAQRST